MMCNKDCLHCIYDDCIDESKPNLIEEYIAGVMDRKIQKENNSKPVDRFYKYNHSDKRKEANKRYRQTERGKEMSLKCSRNFAKNHPDRVLAKSRLYYQTHKEQRKKWVAEHKEQINAYRRELYKRKKLEKEMEKDGKNITSSKV